MLERRLHRWSTSLIAALLIAGMTLAGGGQMSFADEADAAATQPLTLPEEASPADDAEGPGREPAEGSAQAPDQGADTGQPAAEEPAAEAPPQPEPGTVTLHGSIVRLDHGSVSADPAVQLFLVEGQGYLTLDFAQLQRSELLRQRLRVELALPEGLVLSGDSGRDFTALSGANADAALPVLSAVVAASPQLKAFGNVTPATSAMHKVWTVLVTPSNVAGSSAHASQSAANAAALVASADAYWSAQTAGKVRFSNAGTVPWYKSTVSCATSDTFPWFMNEAYDKALELGYFPGRYQHLVLLFPEGSDCGGMLGLGSLGWSADEGGSLWSIGLTSNDAKSTLAHELGHNLSLGHANWLDCSSSAPGFTNPASFPGNSACANKEYGDAVDVMGYGTAGELGGALNAAHAIRAGLWGSGSYSVAQPGKSTHTLLPVSGYSGKRAVVVGDTYGNDFYVEFRNLSGDDAPHTGGGYGANCQAIGALCATGQPGVRVIRLENFNAKGFSWDDSGVIGRTVSGVKRIDYRAGESFKNGDITIKVKSVSSSKAVVEVTRGKHAVGSSWVEMAFTSIQDAEWGPAVGDAITAVIGQSWKADSYSYQWYRVHKSTRKETKISGATKASYYPVAADQSYYHKVTVTGKIKGQKNKSKSSPIYDLSLQPGLVAGTGTVSVSSTAGSNTLKAVVGGWDHDRLPKKYQWLRDGKAISKATASSYKLTSSDKDRLISVRVTPVTSGYIMLSPGGASAVTSAGTDYTLRPTGTAAISGDRKVGKVLSIAALDYQAGSTPMPGVVRSWQWYRNGKAIKGATKQSYTLTKTDLGAKLTVKSTAKQQSYIAHSVTSAATAKIAKGTIAGTPVASVVKAETSLKLTAAISGFTESGVKHSYQWYRDGKKIAKATKSSYTLTSSDRFKKIHVRVSTSKTAYTSMATTSPPSDYTVAASSAKPLLVTPQHAQQGTTLSLEARSYTSGATLKHQWLRDGKAIKNATGASYTVTSADVGKALSVTVTASKPGHLAHVSTSAKTQKLGRLAFTGTLTALHERSAAESTTLVATPGGIPETGVGYSYQWLRNGASISKATKSSYTLSSSDRGKAISVRITASKKSHTPQLATSPAVNYTVQASTAVTVSGTARVGETLAVTVPESVPVAASSSLQWLRDGAVIKGATGTSYTLVAADRNKRISARVSYQHAGYVSGIVTSAKTAKVATGVISPQGTVAAAAAAVSGGKKFTATVAGWPGGVKVGYQWYYKGKAIKGATKSSYTRKGTTKNTDMKVKVSVSRSGYGTVTKTVTVPL